MVVCGEVGLEVLCCCVANATVILMSVRGPTTAILSFAWPKESIQRKGHPDAAYSLRSSLLNGVAESGFLPLRQRTASLRRPYRANPFKSSGARRGVREKTLARFVGFVFEKM